MHLVALPQAFHRYRDIGGALNFTVFEGADAQLETALHAITIALPDADKDKLRALGCRRLDDRAFFGGWYDQSTRSLLRIGSYMTREGRTLTNPRLADLDGLDIVNGGGLIPEPGCGGEFAYAFSRPPYGMVSQPSEVQRLFDAIRNFVLPSKLDHHILDWTSPDLPTVSPYFSLGMEWWGVFLFTVHVPATGQLTVICGSTTD